MRTILGKVCVWGCAGALLVSTGIAQEAGTESAPVPPPSTAPKRSAADLEKLVAPIALYPDSLLAVMLPASAYPVEIVLAARFVADPANAGKIDGQAWDANVKAVAAIPAALQKLEKDLSWTVELGQAFIDQPLDVMDAIQRLRAEAKAAGTLKSTSEQVVTESQAMVERQYEGEVVYVTNTIVQVQSADPEVIYVPVYDPVKVYEPPPDDDDDDDDDDDGEALVGFAAGVALGAIIANNCDWCYGGVVIGGGGMVIVGGGGHPPYYPPPPYYRPPPYYPPPGYRPPPPGYRPPGVPPPGYRPPPPPAGSRPPGSPPGGPPAGGGSPASPVAGSQLPTAGARPAPATGQRWQPDQSRIASTGGTGTQAGVSTREARGWSTGPSPSPSPSTRPAAPTPGGGAARPAPSPAPSVPSFVNPPPRSSSTAGAFGGVNSGSRDRDFSRRGATSRGAGGRGGGRR